MTVPGGHNSEERRANGLPAQVTAAVRFTLKLPFWIAARIVRHTVQVLFALFVLVLHPQIKWLIGLIARSALVQNTIKPVFRTFDAYIYEPCFAYLSRLPPYWATFSIALPLAMLEPAKLYATVLIAERPKSGVVLWLALQVIGFVLIDRTWAAVRPQSRKIWLVARVHAWGWLNVAYGKYWIRNSAIYRAAMRWRGNPRRAALALWARLVPRQWRKSQ